MHDSRSFTIQHSDRLRLRNIALVVGSLLFLIPTVNFLAEHVLNPLFIIALASGFLYIVFFVKPMLGIYALLVYSPIHAWIYSRQLLGGSSFLGGHTLSGALKDVLLFVVMGAWLSRLVYSKGTGYCFRGSRPLSTLVLLYILWAIIRTPGDYSWLMAIAGLRSSVEFIALFFLAASVVESPKQIIRSFWIIVVAEIPMVLAGIFQLLEYGFLYYVNPIFIGVGASTGRISALYGPLKAGNTVGVEAAVVIILCLVLWQRANIWARIALGGMLSLEILNLIFSFSRRAWLALVITLVYLYVVRRAGASTIKLKRLLIVMVTCGALFLIPWPWVIKDRALSVFSLSDYRNAVKIHELKYLFGRSTNSIVTFLAGEGLGAAGRVTIKGAGDTVHSSYLLFLVQSGIIGLVLFGAILLVSIKTAHRLDKFSGAFDDIKLAAFGILGCLSVLGVASLFGSVFQMPPFSQLFWLFVGFLSFMANQKVETNSQYFVE